MPCMSELCLRTGATQEGRVRVRDLHLRKYHMQARGERERMLPLNHDSFHHCSLRIDRAETQHQQMLGSGA
jgi:hypothetical protein